MASGKRVCRVSESASDVPSSECYATPPWRRASESASDVPSCERFAARETDMICDHASHVLRHHIGVTTVERPDPKDLSTFSQCTGDLNSCPPDLELDALTKWLASLC